MVEIVLDFVLRQDAFALEMHERVRTQVLALFGPSGSGKTTALEAIAGLRRPSRGEIEVGGRSLFSSRRGIDVPPRDRRVGYVPQDALLFPHLDVRRNILYGSTRGEPPPLERVLAILEIEPLIDRAVTALSGGERQRVALARALMSSPRLLLLDEPLAAVDVPRRRRIVPYLSRVRDELAIPMVYVTHDAEEVRALADHVLVLDEAGRVARAGTPEIAAQSVNAEGAVTLTTRES